MASEVASRIYEFKDAKTEPDKFSAYPPPGEPEMTPLVIDNGSYHLRAGWATESEPTLVFKNVMARNRGNKKDREWDVLVGNDIPDLEAVRWMIRTAFDFNVVFNFSVQETIFDHTFTHLGINAEGNIPHPIVLTEPVANPAYSRKLMSELLFEAYDIPRVSYGIDSAFSYHYNKKTLSLGENSLVVSSGFQSTHILPIVAGQLDVSGCRRINLGGYNNGAYLQRLLQLKYPKQSSVFTLTRMDDLLREFGQIPINYMEEIGKWKNPKFKADNTIKLKIPERHVTTGNQGSNRPSNRVISLGRKSRQMEYKLYDLECILELEQENQDAFAKAMSDAGCKDVEQVQKKIKRWQSKIDRLQQELTSLASYSPQITEIPLTIERHQGLEILFKPSLVGYEQAGIGEVMESVLATYSEDQQNAMAENVLITGGNTRCRGFTERVEAELTECRPFGSRCRVKVAQDPSLDAWKGARQWAVDNIDSTDVWMTREEFQENGWEYMKEHCVSNMIIHPVTGQG